jgi:hypothetical protein
MAPGNLVGGYLQRISKDVNFVLLKENRGYTKQNSVVGGTDTDGNSRITKISGRKPAVGNGMLHFLQSLGFRESSRPKDLPQVTHGRHMTGGGGLQKIFPKRILF